MRAFEMTTAAIEHELRALDETIDAFESASDDDVGYGGSPGEGMYERHAELTSQLKMRAST